MEFHGNEDDVTASQTTELEASTVSTNHVEGIRRQEAVQVGFKSTGRNGELEKWQIVDKSMFSSFKNLLKS